MATHTGQPDGDTGYCAECPLPLTHPIHRTANPVTAPTLAPLASAEARVRSGAPATSTAAAARAFPRSGTVRSAVFSVIARRAQGATDDEIEVILDRTHQSVSAARNSLAADGWIEPRKGDDGHHTTRRTRSGNDAYAWAPTAVALAQMPPRAEAV